MTVNNNTPVLPVQTVQTERVELTRKDSMKHNWNNHKVSFLLANTLVGTASGAAVAGTGAVLGFAFLASNPIGWAVLAAAVASVAVTALTSLIILSRKVTIEKPVAQIQPTQIQPQGIKAKALAAVDAVKNKAVDSVKAAKDAVVARPKLAGTVALGAAAVIGGLAYLAKSYFPAAQQVVEKATETVTEKVAPKIEGFCIDPLYSSDAISDISEAPNWIVTKAFQKLSYENAKIVDTIANELGEEVCTLNQFVLGALGILGFVAVYKAPDALHLISSSEIPGASAGNP